MDRTLVLFQSTHAVIKAERLCLERLLPCQVIPVPRYISSECGLALEIPGQAEASLTELLTSANIVFTLNNDKGTPADGL